MSKVSFSQEDYANYGDHYIHSDAYQVIYADFYNQQSGYFVIDGSLWLRGNIINQGGIDFTGDTNYPRLVKMDGKKKQLLSGQGTANFYTILFNNSLVEGFDVDTEINIFNTGDFTHGIINVEEPIKIVFEKNAEAIHVSDSSFVDGWVQKIGNDAFVFPIGDNGFYRFAAISSPEKETDRFSARYLIKEPALLGVDIQNTEPGLNLILDNEFWEITRENGTIIPKLTLSWDMEKNSVNIPNNPELLRIVRWNGEMWINEGNDSWIGDTQKGTISSQITGFGYFTLAVAQNNNPYAGNDTVYTTPDYPVYGNVLANDYDPDGHALTVVSDTIENKGGVLTISENGDFTFSPTAGFFGVLSFQYTVCDDFIPVSCTTGNLVVILDDDTDNDSIPDIVDIDDDNDGITDAQEGDGKIDTDGDGIPDSKDPDSDNDGVNDSIEGHIAVNGNTLSLNFASGTDSDNDGIDDAFDPDQNGTPAPLNDNDNDGIPDWRDTDDDNDGILTKDENYNFQSQPLNLDTDNDGIPDYLDLDSPVTDINDDTVFTFSGIPVTVYPLDNDSPDFDVNTLEIISPMLQGTVIVNSDGSILYTPYSSYSGKEIIEYQVCTESGICVRAKIEVEIKADLFIPQVITPNGDGKNDIFEIKGIELFENTRLTVFNRWGDKVFETNNYLNDWDGTNTFGGIGDGKTLPVGTYYYILEYGERDPVTGFVYIER